MKKEKLLKCITKADKVFIWCRLGSTCRHIRVTKKAIKQEIKWSWCIDYKASFTEKILFIG